jgi:hypothetical protein
MIPFDQLQAARARLASHVRRTPVVAADDGAVLKLENLQPTGSYKVRGFFAAPLALSPERRAAGLLTLSAGNAAQACAYVALHLGVPCRTVMPDTAPATKVAGVKRWDGVPWQMPRDEMLAWLANRGYEQESETFIHPRARRHRGGRRCLDLRRGQPARGDPSPHYHAARRRRRGRRPPVRGAGAAPTRTKNCCRRQRRQHRALVVGRAAGRIRAGLMGRRQEADRRIWSSASKNRATSSEEL